MRGVGGCPGSVVGGGGSVSGVRVSGSGGSVDLILSVGCVRTIGRRTGRARGSFAKIVGCYVWGALVGGWTMGWV